MGCGASVDKQAVKQVVKEAAVQRVTEEPPSLPTAAAVEAVTAAAKRRRDASARDRQAAGDCYEAACVLAGQMPAPEGSTWHVSGGAELEPLLDFTTLICIRWLLAVARGEVRCVDETNEKLPPGVIPAWQQLPAAAVAPVASLRRWGAFGLPIGVFSYGWASKSHPDPTGAHLRALRPLLEAAVALCDKQGPEFTRGFLWDYMSLPQRGRTKGWNEHEDDRTAAQQARFRAGLAHINVWYGHQFTHTVVLDTPMPATAEEPHPRPYEGRGWCKFESCMSTLIKDYLCFIRLGEVKSGSGPEGSSDHGSWEAIHARGRRSRAPPLAPDEFDLMIQDKDKVRFTNGKDLTDVVIPQYREGFLRLMRGAEELKFTRLGWGDKEVVALVSALTYVDKHVGAPRLRVLDLSSNLIGDGGACALAEYLMSTRAPIAEIRLSGNQIGAQGAADIARGLAATAAPIQTLLLCGNPFVNDETTRTIRADSMKVAPRSCLVLTPFPGFHAKVEECQARALTPADAKAFLEAHPEALLLDVQDPGNATIPGSHSVSLGTLFFKASTDETDFTDPVITGRMHDAPIVVNCGLGGQARLAAKVLMDYGFTNVQTIEGGCLAWKKADLPLVQSS